MSEHNNWVDIAAINDLNDGSRLEIELNGTYLAIVKLEGVLHAFEDRCTHDGESLAGAELELDPNTPCGVVVCPRHGARFCIKTGDALTPPAYEPLRIFEIREYSHRIQVRGV
ncbi:MAG: ferredoxin [Gammaproteobacteria bacterium]|nr:ferredoxin [Gammaproteobacteria bacterium]